MLILNPKAPQQIVSKLTKIFSSISAHSLIMEFLTLPMKFDILVAIVFPTSFYAPINPLVDAVIQMNVIRLKLSGIVMR